MRLLNWIRSRFAKNNHPEGCCHVWRDREVTRGMAKRTITKARACTLCGRKEAYGGPPFEKYWYETGEPRDPVVTNEVNCHGLDPLGRNRQGNALLFYAWGETDRPSVAIIRTLDDLMKAHTSMIGGDVDELAEFLERVSANDWDECGTIEEEFEIGGFWLGDVCVG